MLQETPPTADIYLGPKLAAPVGVSLMFATIGSVVVLLSVVGSFIVEGGSMLLLWHPAEVLTICGAALGAFLISNPMKVAKIRKSGMLAIEADVEHPEKSQLFTDYPRILADHHMVEFITDCLRLIIGGNLESARAESAVGLNA